jgi:hydroxymethylbilane synthase
LKDLQTVQPEGLCITAVSKREMPNDVLISKKYRSIADLPQNAKVATGSLRRKSQILHYRPNLEIFEIRGNVPTRLKKFEESDLDAMILAFAGVHRLNLDENIAEIIPFEIMLPAVGQGAMAVEIRTEDVELKEFLVGFDDAETHTCVIAERAFLRSLEGGCQVPIGANAVIQNDEIHLEGFVGSLNGKTNLREKISGKKENAKELGERLAQNLIEKGANEILERTREKVENLEEEVL